MDSQAVIAAGMLEGAGTSPEAPAADRAATLAEIEAGPTLWVWAQRTLGLDDYKQRIGRRIARWRAPMAACPASPEIDAFFAATQYHDLRFEVSSLADWSTLTAATRPGAATAAYVRRRAISDWQWRWPLRFGVLASPDAARLVTESQGSGRYDHLYSVFEANGSDTCELLFITPDRIGESFGAAAVVVVLGVDPAQPSADLLDAIPRLGNAGVVFCPANSLAWVEGLVVELSHDLPLDLALARVLPNAVLLADPDFVGRATVRQWGMELSTALHSRGDKFAAEALDALLNGRYASESGEATDSTRISEVARQAGIEAAVQGGPPRAAMRPPAPKPFTFDAGAAPPSAQPTVVVAAVEPPSPEPAPATAPPGDVEQRTVNAQILRDGTRRNTFVAGADNIIRCWIGLPDQGAATADEVIPHVSIPEEGLPLRVQLYWRDGRGQEHTDDKPMLLPASRTARSGDCDLLIHVPDGERYVSADIVFRCGGRAFEVVRLEAFALAADESEGPQHEVRVRVQASRRQVIERPDSQPVDATFVFGENRPSARAATLASSTLRVFGDKRSGGFDLSDARVAIRWLNEALFATEKLVVRRHAAAAAGSRAEEVLDTDDPDVRRLLRDMARHGAGLYNQLIDQHFTDPGDRIEVFNVDPDNYVPLEFVYDRGYPVELASFCPGGLEALQSGADTCPTCQLPVPETERSHAPVICPFGFWSLRKIIERVAVGDAGQPSMSGAVRRSLPVIDSVAFASSHLVPDAERKATQDALQQRFRRVFLADNWSEWREAMTHRPTLLMLLPHHGIQASLDYLEIGAEQLPEDIGKLSRSQIVRHYVNADGRDPGPIVLLLGCQTGATTDTGYVQLTQIIQQQRASIVLGTLSEILGRHAAPLARELVAELVAVEDPVADFGTIMRRVRRRMLARGYLMALCLVALGDAEWRLTPRPRASNP